MTAKNKVRHAFRNTRGLAGTPADPEAVAALFRRIRKETGTLLPVDVVRESEPDDSPSHVAFTWEDLEAARLFREQQARVLIRSLVTVDVKTKEVERVYVHVPPPGDGNRQGTYEPIGVVVEHPDMLAAAMREVNEALVFTIARARELRRRVADDQERVAIVGVIMEALGTAQQALGKLH